MACTSLLSYSKSCGSAITAGVSKLYLLSHQDTMNIGATNSNFTISAGGLISEIGLDATKKFVEIGINRNTVGIKETFTKDAVKGTSEISTELELVVTNMSPEARTFVDSIAHQPVVALIKLKSGSYVVTGLNGFTEVASIEGGSGIAGTDLNGYTIKFTGVEEELLRNVDPTIINTLTV